MPVRLRVYAACKAVDFEPPPAISGKTASGESVEEALINAILRLKDVEDEPKGPPPQIMPPALPRPRVRPRPESPVIDASDTDAVRTRDCQAGETRGVERRYGLSTTDDLSAESQSEPDPVEEITPEECAYISGLPPHLRTGRWAPK